MPLLGPARQESQTSQKYARPRVVVPLLGPARQEKQNEPKYARPRVVVPLLGPARQRKSKTKPKDIEKSQNEPRGQDQGQNARLCSARANIGVRSRAKGKTRQNTVQPHSLHSTLLSIHIHPHKCHPFSFYKTLCIFFGKKGGERGGREESEGGRGRYCVYIMCVC